MTEYVAVLAKESPRPYKNLSISANTKNSESFFTIEMSANPIVPIKTRKKPRIILFLLPSFFS